MTFPVTGEASTYSDYFIGKKTSNGDTYSHDAFTAALLPKSRWYALPMGTKLKVTYQNREIVVKVNDRGAGKVVGGKADEIRVLDLSRAAMANLLGKRTAEITDKNAGVLFLSSIQLMPDDTPTGPVKK
jgi:rare lipoprotein A